MSPSMLFPHPRKEEESLSTPPPTSQSIWAYAWLLPDNHLTQSHSLLPNSREKPFLSARKESVRKVSFGVTWTDPLRPRRRAACHTCSACSEPKACDSDPKLLHSPVLLEPTSPPWLCTNTLSFQTLKRDHLVHMTLSKSSYTLAHIICAKFEMFCI